MYSILQRCVHFVNAGKCTLKVKTYASRNVCISASLKKKMLPNDNNHEVIEDETDYIDRVYEQLANKCFDYKEHSCFIIHPYVKWGPKKEMDTSPQQQMSEAVALIKTLSSWEVRNQLLVPLETLDKKQLFGSGTLEKLKTQIRSDRNVTAVFVNLGTLKNTQISELEMTFGVPVLDRYKIVMQILRVHATSKHAKLQVALAEIPYLRSRLKYMDDGTGDILETRKRMLLEREQKLRNSIKKLRSQRQLLRNKRKQLNYPIVAVIGYTNAGKTSLIKSLTGEKNLQPRDQLFATLDVTMHAGLLPSNLEVLYVDTVGFISNIPTNLIECFVATLEDAVLADVIIHVQDISNEDVLYQCKHVEATLQLLAEKTGIEGLMKRIISVGNKIDSVLKNTVLFNNEMILVSAKNMTGIDVLRQTIEDAVLRVTGRQRLTIRLPTGGDEVRWLYKNATVIQNAADPDNFQFQFLTIIITQAKINQFHHIFIATSNK